MSAPVAQNEQAERSVIGAVLLRNEAAAHLTLTPEDFFLPAHRTIWGAILELRARKQPIDPVSIEARLNGRGGGWLFGVLSSCIADVPTADNIDHYAGLVAAASLDRRVRIALNDLSNNERLEGAQLLEAATNLVKILRPSVAGAALLAGDAVRKDWGTLLPPAKPTGVFGLDAVIGGLRAESVYMLVAPSGRGKTGLAAQMALHVSKTSPLLYVATELSRRQTLARFIAQKEKMPWLTVYELGPTHADTMAKLLEKDHPLLRVVELTRGMSIVDEAKRVADTEGRAPLVVVDYLQHVARHGGSGTDPRLANSALSFDLTQWARAEKAAALVISSTNRGYYTGNEDRTAEDFSGAAKESGDLDFDASGNFFLDTDLCPPGGTSAARLHIAKSRFSASGGVVGLRFHGAIGYFTHDPTSALSEDEQQILDAMAVIPPPTLTDLPKAAKLQKARTLKVVKNLVAKGLMDRCPLRLLPQKEYAASQPDTPQPALRFGPNGAEI